MPVLKFVLSVWNDKKSAWETALSPMSGVRINLGNGNILYVATDLTTDEGEVIVGVINGTLSITPISGQSVKLKTLDMREGREDDNT